MNAWKRLAVSAAALALGAVAAVAVSPGTANAGYVETNCTVRSGGPVVLYWDYWQGGASVCLSGFFNTLSGYYFDNDGLAGAGTSVYNNAASAFNMDTTSQVLIWSGTNHTGSFQNLTPCCDEGSALNLGPVANQDKSITWSSYP
ncbi:MAG: hypothetical protein ACM3JP_01500 [Betaproteobacteria bacterium]